MWILLNNICELILFYIANDSGSVDITLNYLKKIEQNYIFFKIFDDFSIRKEVIRRYD